MDYFKSIPELFENSVKRFENNPLLWEKSDETFIPTTYLKTRELVYHFAAGLKSIGLNKKDRVAIISEGRNDWVISELSIFYNNAISVPVSVKIEEEGDLFYRLHHSECRFAVVSGRNISKLLKIKTRLNDLEKIILLDGDNDDSIIVTKSELYKLGKEFLEKEPDYFSKNYKTIDSEDFANICYTSGTTSDPKGIILTHLNYTSNVEQASKLLFVPEYYKSLLILPWDHAFAHTAGIYTLIRNGASMASVELGNSYMETLKNIPKNIKETKPHFLLSVPALAKNFRKGIFSAIKSKGSKIEKLFNRALDISYKYNGLGFDKAKGTKILLKPLISIFDKLFFKKIRDGFGGNMEFFIGGGALLDLELQKFFYAIGIPMFQGYGLTEAAPVISSNVPKRHKLGSSGFIVDDLQVKIVDNEGNELPLYEKGEIICKGPNVMKGYWKNPEATSETIIQGWLHTGDLGYLDEDGFLYVLGRFKSLLIGSDGEKYSPEGIEEAFVEKSELIDQIMLYNNQNPLTIALVYPNKQTLLSIIKSENIDINKREDLIRLINLYITEIDKFKAGGIFEGMFPQRWLPANFLLLHEGFSEENKFINSTLKMVRKRIEEHYIYDIEYLFSSEGSKPVNEKNINNLKKLLKN